MESLAMDEAPPINLHRDWWVNQLYCLDFFNKRRKG